MRVEVLLSPHVRPSSCDATPVTTSKQADQSETQGAGISVPIGSDKAYRMEVSIFFCTGMDIDTFRGQ